MGTTTGGILGVRYPLPGEVCRLPVILLNARGEYVTGETWDAIGMDVKYLKEEGTAYASFPSFSTSNWDEIGRGLYVVIIDGDEIDEVGLLDTEGLFSLYVKTSSTRGDIFGFKNHIGDSLRLSTGSLGSLSDGILSRLISAVEGTAAAGTVARALAILGHKTEVVGSNLVVYYHNDTVWFSMALATDELELPLTSVNPI